MPDVFKLANSEGDCLTRSQGEKVRVRLVEYYDALSENDELVIDFEGIVAMTPSFADECFGKLAQRIGAERFRASVTLTGANETLHVLLNSVLRRRLAGVRLTEGHG